MNYIIKIAFSLLCLNSAHCYAKHTLFLGGGGVNYQLIENDLYTNQQLVKESGNLISINYGVDYALNQHLILHAQAQQSYGIIDYNGQTQSGIPHQSETTHIVNQGSASLGYLLSKQSEIYIGFHGQQDLRDVANHNGVYGATELYTKIFSKIGLKQGFQLHKNHYIQLLTEIYQPLLAESFVDSRVNDDVTITLKQGNAYAWGIQYQYQYANKQGLFLHYNDTNIRYKKSSLATQSIYGQATGNYLYQPPIRFQQKTLAVGMTWQF